MDEILRKRFCNYINNHWKLNNHNLPECKSVYALISMCPYTKDFDIEYIGSSTNLFQRYKSHKIPSLIQELGKISLLYYLPMNYGFYDYEIKLIKKLKPRFNKQHKNVAS